MPETQPFENWIWLELIGFDSAADDLGVADYIDRAGFVPDAVCLLVSSPDFVLQHPGMAGEAALPADICSRGGHSHNRFRARQSWTNRQVRALVEALQARGTKVHLSFFSGYLYDKFHHEWASDHTEVLTRHNNVDHFGHIHPLKRFADGTPFEDYFAERVVETLADYGFDGWHGPDGWGPLSGPLYSVDFSDDILDQFVAATGVKLPQAILKSDQTVRGDRIKRAEHIWRHCRAQWITFWADRWAGFWKTMTDRLHAAGKQSIINSAWTRAPWEALYRYGVDYRKIAEAGVDAMVVETCAASLNMDPRSSTRDPVRSYDMYSMLALIRAYVPQMKLVYLQTTMDVVEQWDAITHTPTVLEREVYNVNNVYQVTSDGSLRRASDGGLTCLGDGMVRHDWQVLDRWLTLSIEAVPERILGATAVWSDATVPGQVDEFTRHRTMNLHRLAFNLMDLGAPVQSVVRAQDLGGADGALLVLNAHLFDQAELATVVDYAAAPVVFVGTDAEHLKRCVPQARLLFTDAEPVRPMHCAVLDRTGAVVVAPKLEFPAPKTTLPEDPLGLIDGISYWDRLTVRPVSAEFFAAVTDVIWQAVRSAEGPLAVTDDHRAVTAMFMQLADGSLRVALKNRMPWYARATVTVPRDVSRVDVRTDFPLVSVAPEGNTFAVRVPGKGLTVVDVTMDRPPAQPGQG